MTLQERIHAELKRVGEFGPDQSGRSLSLDTANGRLHGELVAADRIGCAFRSLTFTTPKLADASTDTLRALGESLAKRLTYLLEPLALVEVDAQQGAQLRSSPPQVDESCRAYYELLATRGGELSLHRYEKRADSVRCQTTANVTHEVFARLCDDLSSAVG